MARASAYLKVSESKETLASVVGLPAEDIKRLPANLHNLSFLRLNSTLPLLCSLLRPGFTLTVKQALAPSVWLGVDLLAGLSCIDSTCCPDAARLAGPVVSVLENRMFSHSQTAPPIELTYAHVEACQGTRCPCACL